MLSGLSESEYTDLVVSVGTHRGDRRLVPIRVSDLLVKAVANNSLERIAEQLELRDPSTLHHFLALQKLTPEVQGLISWGSRKGTLNFSTAAQIARLSNGEERSELIKAVLEQQLTKQDVIAVIQRMRRGNVSVETALNEILKLRPIVERQYLFVGRISAPHNATEEDCRNRLRINLASRYGAENVISVSVKNGRYAILLAQAAIDKPGETGASGHEIDSLVKTLCKD